MHLKESIVTEGAGGIAETVCIAGEIEDIAISDETPVAETRDVEADIPTVLVADAGSFGESVTKGIVEVGGIVTVKGD